MADAHVPSGIPVDASGGPTVDPTENVLDLVMAAVKRIDDMAELRARIGSEQFRRMEESLGYQEKIAILRAEFAKEIRNMESERVNSIRSVDVANAAATAAQLLSAVTTLATTANVTAETLRNQVAATAAAVASQTERVVNPIIERIALLEKSSYTGTGRSAGLDKGWVVLLGSVSLVAALVGLAVVGVTLVIFLNRSPQSPVYVSPPATTVTPPPVSR